MIKSQKIFSRLLRESLKKKFKKVPSAAVLANEFNFRAYDSETITRETARKWLLGLSIPRHEKLRVLVKWLNLNMQEIFTQASRDVDKIQDHAIEEIKQTCEEMSSQSKKTLLQYAKFLKHIETNGED